MSQEDADKIRRAYEVWNASGPEAVTSEFWAEDAIYREAPAGPMRGSTADALSRLHGCEA